jgi:hypothetical protein
MKLRTAALLATALVALSLSAGCQAQAPATKPAAKGDAAPVERTLESSAAVSAGSQIKMRNGLAVTVPQGWAGGHQTYRAPGAPVGMYGDAVSEALVLRRTDGATTSPNTVMLYSRPTSGTAAPEKRKFKVVIKGPEVRVFAGDMWSPDGYGLFAAETSAPGAQPGIVYFGGNRSDPYGSIQRVWALLGVTGAEMPGAN